MISTDSASGVEGSSVGDWGSNMTRIYLHVVDWRWMLVGSFRGAS